MNTTRVRRLNRESILIRLEFLRQKKRKSTSFVLLFNCQSKSKKFLGVGKIFVSVMSMLNVYRHKRRSHVWSLNFIMP